MKSNNTFSSARLWVRASLALMWLVSGMLPLFPQTAELSDAALQLLGVPPSWFAVATGLGMATDIVAALLCIVDDRPRSWYFQLTVVVTYTLLLSVSQVALWWHPFGPLLKNLPIMAMFIWLAQTSTVLMKREWK